MGKGYVLLISVVKYVFMNSWKCVFWKPYFRNPYFQDWHKIHILGLCTIEKSIFYWIRILDTQKTVALNSLSVSEWSIDYKTHKYIHWSDLRWAIVRCYSGVNSYGIIIKKLKQINIDVWWHMMNNMQWYLMISQIFLSSILKHMWFQNVTLNFLVHLFLYLETTYDAYRKLYRRWYIEHQLLFHSWTITVIYYFSKKKKTVDKR